MNAAPYWQLNLVQGLDKVQAGSYNCENCESAKIEDQIKLSCEALETYLTNFKNVPSQIFAIEMRKSKTANGGSKFGWFQFQIQADNQQATPQGVQGLGAVPVQNLDEKLDYLRKSMMLDFEQRELERKKAEFKQEVREQKNALKSEWEKVQSKSAPIKTAFEHVLSGVVMPMLGIPAPPSGLGAVEGDEPIEGVESDRERKIKEIAQKMFDSPLTESQLETVLNQIPTCEA